MLIAPMVVLHLVCVKETERVMRDYDGEGTKFYWFKRTPQNVDCGTKGGLVGEKERERARADCVLLMMPLATCNILTGSPLGAVPLETLF